MRNHSFKHYYYYYYYYYRCCCCFNYYYVQFVNQSAFPQSVQVLLDPAKLFRVTGSGVYRLDVFLVVQPTNSVKALTLSTYWTPFEFH